MPLTFTLTYGIFTYAIYVSIGAVQLRVDNKYTFKSNNTSKNQNSKKEPVKHSLTLTL